MLQKFDKKVDKIELNPMRAEKRILILEDDPVFQNLIEAALIGHRCEVLDSVEGLNSVLANRGWETQFECAILDLTLKDGDAMEWIGRLANALPVLVISGSDTIQNKLTSFRLGAVDFLDKPFHPLELLARVDKRIESWKKKEVPSLKLPSEDFETCGLVVSPKQFRVTHMGRDLNLTRIEFEIFHFLASHKPGWILTREILMDRVWSESDVGDRTLDTHMSRLRRKLKGTSVSIETHPKIGYSLKSLFSEKSPALEP